MKLTRKTPLAGPSFSPIGLELRGRWMKAAQAVGPRWRLARVERVVPPGPRSWLPQPDAVARLDGALRAAGFQGETLILAAPSAALLSQSLELPPKSSGAPIEALAIAEMARACRMEPGTLETAMWETPGGGRAGVSNLLAMGMDHASASHLLSAFDHSSMTPITIDASPAALGRLPRHSPESAHAFVDVGWDDTVLCIVLGGLPIYQRRLDDGGLAAAYNDIAARDSATPAAVDSVLFPAGAMHADAQADVVRATLLSRWRGSISNVIEPLAKELDRSLTYASHRFPTTPIVSVNLCGDGALLPGLADRLQSKVSSVPVAAVPDAAFAVAQGLCSWTGTLAGRSFFAAEAA